MLRFKQHITEQVKTKKVFIDHLDKMKPLKFLEFAKKLDKEFGGVLSKEKISITEKIDGSALRVGQDANGNSFIESSMSASMFNVGDFEARDISKGYSGEIGKKFDNILKEFKNDKQFQSVLKKYNTNGIKVIGEILYVPMGIDEVDKIKFIRISYDKKKLGTLLTFVPFEVIDGEGNVHPKQADVISDLYKISNDTRKILKPTIHIDKDINIAMELKDFDLAITKQYENLEDLLTSRKKVDKELKAAVIEEIGKYQKQITSKILTYIKSGSLGPDYEGIVIKMNDGSIIKIVTDVFKAGSFQKK
jgi:hypothetical protein